MLIYNVFIFCRVDRSLLENNQQDFFLDDDGGGGGSKIKFEMDLELDIKYTRRGLF